MLDSQPVYQRGPALLLQGSPQSTDNTGLNNENGQRVVKIVNKMRYPLQISYTGFKFLRDDGPLVSLDLTLLARLQAKQDTILLPFEEAVYTVDLHAGEKATIHSDFANLALGLSMFQELVGWVLAVGAFVEDNAFTTVDAKSVVVVEDGESVTVAISETRISLRTYASIATIMKSWLDGIDCGNAIFSLDPGSIIRKCFTDRSSQLLKNLFKGIVGTLVGAILTIASSVSAVIGWFNAAHDSAFELANYNVAVSRTQAPITQPPTPPPGGPPPTSHAVNAYDNYGQSNLAGHAMCRGNPDNPLSMPGGTGTQTFTVPAGVATLSSAKVQIDPASVTAHMSIAVNGAVKATASADAVGDTHFNFGPISVHAGDTVKLSITFTATYGKIITLYTVGNPGGKFTASNSCPDGAPNFSTTTSGLRAVVSGMS